jgi:hypothetical protein
LLFDAPDEVALMSQHVAHDGWPEKLGVLAAQPGLFEIASWLAACLRRDPRERPDATATRRALARLAPALSEVAWPLGSGSIAEAS